VKNPFPFSFQPAIFAFVMLIPLIDLITALGGIEHCQFASLTYRSKETQELARHNILLGFSYQTCVEKSLMELEAIMPALSGVDLIAASELAESFRKTLAGTQDAYTKAETYAATSISGLKVNTVDGTLQLFGLQQSKTVIEPGTHKTVNSAPKTIAKNKLRKELPVGKFREYALDAETIQGARVNGKTIEFA
jgi:hypothetical protein